MAVAWSRFTGLVAFGTDLAIQESMLLRHFVRDLSPGAGLCLDLASGGSFSHLSALEGQRVLDKILEKASDGSTIEEPRSHPQDPPEPSYQDESQNTHTPCPQTLMITNVPEPSTSQDTERVSESVTNPPSVPPFSFDDKLLIGFGKTSRLPKDGQRFKRTSQPAYLLPEQTHQMREDLLWLTAVLNREWLEERRLDTKMVRFYPGPSLVSSHVSDMFPQDILYDPRVGVNIIPKHVVDTHFPTLPRSKSDIRLKWNKNESLENHGVIRVIPVTLRDKRMFLDFHVFDIPEEPMPLILVGIPIASLIKTTATPGQLQLQFGKEVFEVGMSRALNNKTEAKPKVDLLEEVMGISLEEEEDQQSLEEEASNFSAVEEPLEFEKLGESLRPNPSKIELKQLPPGLKYAFLNRNPDTPVIISDKLTENESR